MLDFVALCYEFPPWLLAGAIWTEKLLAGLRDRGWKFEVITAAPNAMMDGVTVHHVPNPGRPGWVRALSRIKADKFAGWAVWPDDAIYWNNGAVQRARELIRERKPRMIVNFVMPYGAGIVGERLRAETGLPLVYCFSDSHSCTDMHERFPTYFHYRYARRLEDRCVRAADAAIYVSQFNADLVRRRQPADQRDKFHTVRLGAESSEFAPVPGVAPDPDGPVRVVYIGSMGGWYEWYNRRPTLSRLKRTWDTLGEYRVTRLDHRTHTPVFVGRAVQKVLAARPDWRGRVFVDVYGGRVATEEQIRKVLEVTALTDVVRVHGPQARDEIARQTRTADLLFQCVQNRTDGTPGGRIASKTYEYLMTDRPILAAVPRGENWDYYADKPGVFLVAPDDADGMARAITEVCEAKFDRRAPLAADRSGLRAELSYTHRAEELDAVLRGVLRTREGAAR
ncbi:glycosyltransferase [Gemmata sp. JC673]|uniref:Glycosyltransferase n=1 Tax=Gemmata algarum TaxID=2975278 RepID=A0ABU5ET34_9BACT|nr:glycosyltransferase [Gemmata algarum]MDY3558320.1 glycosyltransferase [Gemmata algarum]